MPALRISLALFAFLLLAGWMWLRKPWSPTDDLPAVTYTAFQVTVPDAEAGKALALAARGWQGVTAGIYNPSSSLLVLSHTDALSVQDLQSRLNILAAAPVSQKTFAVPAGPQCPVPASALAALPQYLLVAGLVLALCSVALTLSRRRTGPTIHH
jgi:hypothetical protein